MATQEFDVIKDLPGYKVILKSVLKSQIQQLVEQLASNTEEESLILTASVADGTLSHLGSQFGKGFLEDHEDVKSQFLGFCLKSHHKRKQDEEARKTAEALQQSIQPLQNIYGTPPDPYLSRNRFQSPRGQGPSVRPIAIHKASPMRSPGVRYAPYNQIRPGRRPSIRNQSLDSNPSPVKGDNLCDGQTIKIEPVSDNEALNQSESNTFNTEGADSSSQSTSEDPSQNFNSLSGETDFENVSETSNASIPLEQTSDKLTDSNFTNTMLEPNNQSQSSDNTENKESVCVKMEAISESELELEITGVEPGKPTLSQDSWDSSVSMAMNFDPAQGAAGNQADLLPQGYNTKESVTFKMESATVDSFICRHCGKMFKGRSALISHEKVHEGKSPYECCGKSFRSKEKFQRHRANKHGGMKFYKCEECDSSFATKTELKQHKSYHTEPSLACSICSKGFRTKAALNDHLASHSGERKYKCLCGNAYIYSQGLSNHRLKCSIAKKTE